jgi:serine/threonine protein kinase
VASQLCFANILKQLADIVLELVKGGDLLDRILKRGGLPEDETRDIVYQICDALAVR